MSDRPPREQDTVRVGEPAEPGRAWNEGALPVLAPGQRYHAGDEIGRGGNARVLRAHDGRLDRHVVIKELLQRDPHAARRFLREARITARLQHPGIVPVHDVGRWPGDVLFYTMKEISGRTLGAALAGARTLADRLALLPRLIAAGEAVAYAHSRGVIHRDLKPANVIVGEFGETVVIDWGLAKETGSQDSGEDPPGPPPGSRGAGETLVGTVLGTPTYMPPEQARGEPVDSRADVYALGAILYHLLAGRPPYGGEGASARAVLDDVLGGPPPPLPREVPPALASVAARAMARDPTARFAHAGALVAELRRFTTGQLVATHDYSLRERLARVLRQHRVAVGVGVAFALALLGLGAFAIRNVARARTLAEEQRAAAERQRAVAEVERADAEARRDQLVLLQARAVAERDPAAALRWLKQYPKTAPSWDEVHTIAVDSAGLGAAHLVVPAHPRLIWGVAVAPDGHELATASADGTIAVWEPDGTRRRVYAGHQGEANAVTYSPDGRWLASVSDDRSVRVWDRARGTGTVLGTHQGAALAVAWHPLGGALASVGDDGAIIVWDLVGGRRVLFHDPARHFARLAWSPDGRWLAVAEAEPAVWILDARPGVRPPPRRVHGHREQIRGLAFLRDGTLLSGGHDQALRRTDPVTGATSLLGTGGRIESLAAARDLDLVVAGHIDGSIELWWLDSGERHLLRGHEANVRALAVSHDGRELVSGDQLGQLRAWRVPARVAHRRAGADAVTSDGRFAFDASSSLMAYGRASGGIALLDLDDGGTRVLGTTPRIVELGFFAGPDGPALVAASRDGRLEHWDLASGRLAGALAEPVDPMIMLEPLERGAAVAYASGHEVRRWRLGSPASEVLVRLAERVFPVRASRDGRWLAAGAKDAIWLLDTQAGGRTLTGHRGWISSLEFTPDGALLVSRANDQTVRLWPTAGEAPLSRREVGAGYWAVPSPDGARLALDDDQRVVVAPLAAGSDAQAIRFRASGNRRITFAGSRALLGAITDPAAVRVVDVVSGAAGAVRSPAVNRIGFSPDGRWLATVAQDGTLRAWRVAEIALTPAGPEPLRRWLAAAVTAPPENP